MSRRRQEVVALAAGLGLHVAVFALLRPAPGEPLSNLASGARSPAESSQEIELTELPELANAGERVDPEKAASASRSSPSPSLPRTSPHRAELASVDAEAAAPVELAPASESEGEAQPDAAPSRPIHLGLGPEGWQQWLKPPVEGEVASEAPRPRREHRFPVFRAPPQSTTGGLQEGLEERDRALGLGPEGRVLSALREAARAGVAPDVGVARFEVTVHRSGTVQVTLGAASEPRELWRTVAAQAASDLRAKLPRIPPSRAGVKLVVELVLERTLPNGTRVSDLEKPHLDVPPPKFQSTEQAKEQLKRENPTTETPNEDSIALKLDTPGVYVAESGKVCNYRAGVGAIAPGHRLGAAAGPTIQGACDPSHVGAKPQRMVRTRVVELAMF